jgi:hypothetical protein
MNKIKITNYCGSKGYLEGENYESLSCVEQGGVSYLVEPLVGERVLQVVSVDKTIDTAMAIEVKDEVKKREISDKFFDELAEISPRVG